MLSSKGGSKIHWTKLNDVEFLAQLKTKLLEEAQEVHQAQTKEALLEELADVLEVLDAFCDVYESKSQDIINIKNKKFQERGGFKERKFVTVAEHQENGFWEKYCLANPDKYPEVLD